ncbi:hypothetical protein [Micromonospora sp. DT47]|uniref:hypothetical protein n=1 Tax=Micromonospora sp. DT47 TaxID=3393431 RepID=UPI003CEBC7E2
MGREALSDELVDQRPGRLRAAGTGAARRGRAHPAELAATIAAARGLVAEVLG